jgi:hypothetical protein
MSECPELPQTGGRFDRTRREFHEHTWRRMNWIPETTVRTDCHARSARNASGDAEQPGLTLPGYLHTYK